MAKESAVEVSQNKVIGEAVYQIRKLFELSQTDLGKALGLHQAALSRIENNFQKLTVDDLFPLAEAVGIRPYEIVMFMETLKAVEAEKKAARRKARFA